MAVYQDERPHLAVIQHQDAFRHPAVYQDARPRWAVIQHQDVSQH